MANISTGLPFEWDEDGTVDNNDEDEDDCTDDKNESDDKDDDEEKDAFGEDEDDKDDDEEEKDAFGEDEETVHETWIKSRMSVKERIRNRCDISSPFLLLPLFGDIEIGYTLVFGTVVGSDGPVDTISTSLDTSFRSGSAIL